MPSRTIRTAESRRKTRLYLAVGALTLIILLVTLGTAGKEQTLRCERLSTGEVDCASKQSILGLVTLSEKNIAGVQAVSMGQKCVDVNCDYRLELYATQGLVPVTEKYTSNYDQLLNTKEQMNKFFKDTKSSFVEMREETNPVLIIAVVVVFLILWAYLGYLIWQTGQAPAAGEQVE